MKFSRFSIRTTLLVLISILNILIAILVGTGVYHSWQNLEQIRKLSQESANANLLYNTQKFLSIERGLSVALINTSPDIVESLKPEITQNRQAADSKLQEALQKLSTQKNPDIVSAISKVQESYKKVQDLRHILDNKKSSNEGNIKSLYDRTFETFTLAITDIESLIKIYSRDSLYKNTTVNQQIFFKYFIWEVTEYAGREYAQIARLIAENEVPGPAVKDSLIAWKNRAEHDWEISRQFAAASGLIEKMDPFIEEARTHYLLTFDQIKDMFYNTGPGQIQPPYPISIELWLEMASQAVDSLAGLKDMILEETQIYIVRLENDAVQNIIMNLLLFCCALILSFYSWWVILRRVVIPVNTMVDSLYREAHENIPARMLQKGDEIEKLGLVLDVFQENSRRIEKVSKDLEQQRNNLETIFETTLDAIVVINEQGNVTEWNKQAEQIFGWSRNEMIGRNMGDTIVPASYRAAHHAGIKKYLAGGTSKILNRRIEIEALNRKAAVFPIELSVSALRINNELHFVAFISDITDRKNAENERKKYMKSLEDSNRELDDFAYIASHDLKEPLRGLHNFSRFLLEDYADKLDNEGKNMLDTIASLTRRMDELLSALLHYSRLGRTELSVRETDLNEIVRDVLSIFAIKIQETNSDIEIIRPLPVIVCDHIRISEVFQNLIGNALKYNDSKNPKIEIGWRDDHPRYPGQIVCFVKDNGIGIEEKNFEAIFKIFRRLHAKESYGGGTGSGLTIAKKIIVQHGGQIWTESAGKGQGSTFFFSVPSQSKNIHKSLPEKETI